jgi:DNA-binding MarR family transcriptional regulator
MNYQLLANKLYVLSVLIDEIGHDTANALSQSSVAAVFALKYRGPLSITKLGRIIGLTQPATTRLVERLVRGGFVQKSSGPSAREVDIHLTSRGSTLANKLQAKRLERIGNLVAKLSVSEQAQLDALLATMVGAAVESRAQARYLCRFCDHDICDGPVCPVGSAATEIEEHEGR